MTKISRAEAKAVIEKDRAERKLQIAKKIDEVLEMVNDPETEDLWPRDEEPQFLRDLRAGLNYNRNTLVPPIQAPSFNAAMPEELK